MEILKISLLILIIIPFFSKAQSDKETIAKAGIAVGVDGLFIETHPKPSEAKSDGANMLPIDRLDKILQRLLKIRQSLNS